MVYHSTLVSFLFAYYWYYVGASTSYTCNQIIPGTNPWYVLVHPKKRKEEGEKKKHEERKEGKYTEKKEKKRKQSEANKR